MPRIYPVPERRHAPRYSCFAVTPESDYKYLHIFNYAYDKGHRVPGTLGAGIPATLLHTNLQYSGQAIDDQDYEVKSWHAAASLPVDSVVRDFLAATTVQLCVGDCPQQTAPLSMLFDAHESAISRIPCRQNFGVIVEVHTPRTLEKLRAQLAELQKMLLVWIRIDGVTFRLVG